MSTVYLSPILNPHRITLSIKSRHLCWYRQPREGDLYLGEVVEMLDSVSEINACCSVVEEIVCSHFFTDRSSFLFNGSLSVSVIKVILCSHIYTYRSSSFKFKGTFVLYWPFSSLSKRLCGLDSGRWLLFVNVVVDDDVENYTCLVRLKRNSLFTLLYCSLKVLLKFLFYNIFGVIVVCCVVPDNVDGYCSW